MLNREDNKTRNFLSSVVSFCKFNWNYIIVKESKLVIKVSHLSIVFATEIENKFSVEGALSNYFRIWDGWMTCDFTSFSIVFQSY